MCSYCAQLGYALLLIDLVTLLPLTRVVRRVDLRIIVGECATRSNLILELSYCKHLAWLLLCSGCVHCARAWCGPSCGTVHVETSCCTLMGSAGPLIVGSSTTCIEPHYTASSVFKR